MVDTLAQGRELARALTRDIEDSPLLSEAVNRLVFNAPAARAGLLIADIKKDIQREVRGDYSTVLFPRVRDILRNEIRGEVARRKLEAGMGFVGILISGLISAGTAIYTSKLQIKAQEDIAEMQQKGETQKAAAAEADAKARLAEAELAMKQAAAQSPEVTVAKARAGTDVSDWILPVGIGAGALILIFALTRKKKRR
jgi:hypothetical protein